jgi:hypothetical protein
VVRGVSIHVLIEKRRARPNHIRGAELGDPFSALVDPESGPMRPASPSERLAIEQEPGKGHRLNGSGSCGHSVIVDKDGKGDPLLLDERRSVPFVTRADGNDVGMLVSDLLIVLTQLRGMLTAQQSAEMP